MIPVRYLRPAIAVGPGLSMSWNGVILLGPEIGVKTVIDASDHGEQKETQLENGWRGERLKNRDSLVIGDLLALT
jgi:hypothetical protein